MPQNLRRAARPGAARRDTIARMKPIAHIHTDLPQKFGIPRNSFLAPHLQGRIVFEPEYALNSAVAGIDSFSHLWLLWRFENGEPGGGAADVAGTRAAAGQAGARLHPATAALSPRAGLSVRGRRSWARQAVGDIRHAQPVPANPIGLTCVKLKPRGRLTDARLIIRMPGADLRSGASRHQAYIPLHAMPSDACSGWIGAAPGMRLDVELFQQLQARGARRGRAAWPDGGAAQDPRRSGGTSGRPRLPPGLKAWTSPSPWTATLCIDMCRDCAKAPRARSPASGFAPTSAAASAPP